jgi:hypothetical protein
MSKANYGSRPQQVVELLKKMGPSTPGFVQQTLELKATGYVYALLARLEKQGLLKREGGKYSAIEGAVPKRIRVTKRRARQGTVKAEVQANPDVNLSPLLEQNRQLKIQLLDTQAVVRYLESRLGIQN